MPEPISNKPEFSFGLTGDHLRGRLRVDHIQHQAVIDMATEWLEADEHGVTGDTAVINAVDALANAMQGDPTREERDALVDAVESAAGMLQGAEVEFDLATALRLRQELDLVIRALARFGAVHLPGQRGEAA